MDVNWGALSEDERRRALLNDELVQVMPRVAEATLAFGSARVHCTRTWFAFGPRAECVPANRR